MTPEEINKKAYEKYPVKMDVEYDSWGNAEDVDLNARRRQGYIEAYNEISSLPTIKGWVARDSSPVNAQDLNIGKLKIWPKVPYRNKVGLFWMPNFPQDFAIMMLPSDLFPDLRWEDEPIEVEIIVKTKQ